MDGDQDVAEAVGPPLGQESQDRVDDPADVILVTCPALPDLVHGTGGDATAETEAKIGGSHS